jgi:Fic family protein
LTSKHNYDSIDKLKYTPIGSSSEKGAKKMSFPRNTPFNQLPPLPPAGVDLESRPILKATISAHAALGELRGMGAVIPNQNLILRSIALQEARLSSEIENIVTTADEVYRAVDDDTSKFDPATKEVHRYQDALWHGIEAIKNRPLRISLFIEIVSILKNESMGLRSKPGTRISDGQSGTLYTPPEGEFIIREKLEQLETFLESQNEIDPLVKMAIAHYQFEAIHPFSDGNGRTGRILNILFLLKSSMLEEPVLYLSRYIIQNKNRYYDGLRKVTEHGAWEPWILYMLGAVTETAVDAVSRIKAIREGLEVFRLECQVKAPKAYSLDLVTLLFRQPYCRIRDLEESGIAKRQTASQYLQQLSDAGLLKAVRSGNQMLYLNVTLLTILST